MRRMPLLHRKALLLLVAFSLLPFMSASAQSSSPAAEQTPSHFQVSSPIRETLFEGAFRAGYPLPRWENGFLVSWKSDTVSSDAADNLRLYDRGGKLLAKTRVWLDDSNLLRIMDAAPGKNGNVAVVGFATTNSGAVAGYVAEVSILNGSVRMVQTEPFKGVAVTYGPDGGIWILGVETDPQRPGHLSHDHFVVQHYGTDGVLQGQHLLRSQLSCKNHPAASSDRSVAQIMSSNDRIGLFLPACPAWGELKPNGDFINLWRWQTEPASSQGGEPKAPRISSSALTSTNHLFGAMESPGLGIGMVSFDRYSRAWIPVDRDDVEAARLGAAFAVLIGSDGDALVYISGDTNVPADSKKLVWVKPTENQ